MPWLLQSVRDSSLLLRMTMGWLRMTMGWLRMTSLYNRHPEGEARRIPWLLQNVRDSSLLLRMTMGLLRMTMGSLRMTMGWLRITMGWLRMISPYNRHPEGEARRMPWLLQNEALPTSNLGSLLPTSNLGSLAIRSKTKSNCDFNSRTYEITEVAPPKLLTICGGATSANL